MYKKKIKFFKGQDQPASGVRGKNNEKVDRERERTGTKDSCGRGSARAHRLR